MQGTNGKEIEKKGNTTNQTLKGKQEIEKKN